MRSRLIQNELNAIKADLDFISTARNLILLRIEQIEDELTAGEK